MVVRMPCMMIAAELYVCILCVCAKHAGGGVLYIFHASFLFFLFTIFSLDHYCMGNKLGGCLSEREKSKERKILSRDFAFLGGLRDVFKTERRDRRDSEIGGGDRIHHHQHQRTYYAVES